MQKANTNFILVNSLGGGGAERQISYIAPIAAVEKIVCIEPLISYSVPDEKLMFLTKGQGRFYQKAAQLISVPLKLSKFVKKDSHLICFLQLSYILGFIVKLFTGCKYTITVRTNPWGFYEFSAGLKLPFRLYTLLLKKADYVVSNSAATSLEIEKKLKLKRPPITIQNGYDTKKITDMSLEPIEDVLLPVFENNLVFITVGRLFTDKGHWHLLRIFNEVKKQKSGCKLFILGKGPLIQDNEKLCSNLGLSYYSYNGNQPLAGDYDVYFLGFVSNPYKYIKKSYLFLFTSIFEGLPNSPLEAMISGTPCIISDCKSGPREILFPDTNPETVAVKPELSKYGVLIPPFSGEKIYNNSPLNATEHFWVASIMTCIGSSEYYNRLKCSLDEIKVTYSIENVQKKWTHFLREGDSLQPAKD